MKGISISEFYEKMKDELQLTLVAGKDGFNRRIRWPEINRPGLALAGYVDYFAWRRVQILGKVEITYLWSLEPDVSRARIAQILSRKVPCMIVARRYCALKQLLEEADRLKVPLFRTPLVTVDLIDRITVFLDNEFAPSISLKGNLVEVFGEGVFLEGKSGVGKSETALGLLARGHRLITDDVVRIKLRERKYLIGSGSELTRHHMEIRGLGIINVQKLFGAVCFREESQIDLAITLERWDPRKEYERLGIEEDTIRILDKPVPHLTIPVRTGRDLVLMVETAALNHRLKSMGFNPARALDEQLIRSMRAR
ncbi:HPr(Ser) kinase/phosphatase [bacterium]|nr:HPr(Ser) kinase/phosphatase [bacterium]